MLELLFINRFTAAIKVGRPQRPTLVQAAMMRTRWQAAVLALALVFISSCTEQSEPVTPTPALSTPSQQPSDRARPETEWLSGLPLQTEGFLTFDRLSLEEGLSQSVVAAMAQDPRGFLWLGTQDGLNRFDGYEFKIFKHRADEPDSLSDSFISSLLVDEDGVLWAGTNRGLNRYDPLSESFRHYRNDPDNPNSLSGDVVSSLAEGTTGDLWIGTNAGLNRFDPITEQFARYQNNPDDDNSLLANGVTDLWLDDSGLLWIGTGLGLDRFDPATGVFTHFTPDDEVPDSLSAAAVADVYEDEDGTIWVGTNQGLNRFDREAESFTHFHHNPRDPTSLSDDGVNDIYQDLDGQLWVGTTQGGLSRFDPDSGDFIHYRNDPNNPRSISNDNIASIFEDNSGILWFGTFGGGVSRYDPQKAKFLHVRSETNNPASLSNDSIWSIIQDSQGTLWVGTLGGLNRADPGAAGFRHYANDPTDSESLSNDQVWRVFEDIEGTIWIGTSTGLDRFERESEQFTHVDMFTPFAMHESGDGTFWLGTIGGGLARFDRETNSVITNYVNDPTDPNSLSSNFVTAIAENDDGTLWLGTFNGGLNHFNPETETFAAYQNDPDDPTSLPNDTILWLLRDKQDQLWLGTSGGLARLDEQTETFTNIGELEGLPNETVYAILEDDDGFLWISHNRGLSRFDPQKLTFDNYDATDGLQSIEFNQSAAYKGPAGEMYFGGINGFNIFHPDSIRDSSFIPPVVITDFLLFNEQVDEFSEDSPLQQAITEADEIQLDYTDDFVTFEYAALHYSSPEENEYAYFMEGYEPDWNYVGDRRFASYTGLPPGDYTFRVKAANSDGLWNEEGAATRVLVAPPFWQTWWFISLATVVVLGSIGGAVTYRIRSVEKHRRELEVQVTERTHELQEALDDLQRSKEAAEAANRAKSVFLTNVSHELRTPLNAIIGFSQLMIRLASTEQGGRLTPDQEENLRVIQRSGEHLLGLINDVLDMSKIEAGRATLNLHAFDLHRLLEGLKEMFGLRAEDKGLALEFDVDPEVPRYITADEGKLRQILMNLLGNAVKFTSEGGVVLRARMITGNGQPMNGPAILEEWDSVSRIRVEVEDTGPGISKEDLEQIFVPFTQSAAGMIAQEGTGLGLSISRQFARLMGGNLSAESEPGHGSNFVLEMPFTSAEHDEVPLEEPARLVVGLAPGQRTYRLLIVDDSEVNRRLLVRLFEPLGFEVREAINGQEAVDIWKSWSPHLIWMDMRMPVMDGYEATRRIKATTQGQGTVIVALTASALEEDKEVILSEGCDDYVRKPFREEDLFNALARHLGVHFVYEEHVPAKLSRETQPRGEVRQAELAGALASLPEKWRQELHQAALLGYQDRLWSLIGQVREKEPDLARNLAWLAERYDHQAILDLLHQAENIQ